MTDKKKDFKCVSDNVILGKNVKVFQFTNLYGCKIGENTKVGVFVEIQKNVEIGKNCKISSHSFLCEGVKIEDNVFIGHGVMFINDKYPRATTKNGNQQTESDWKVEKTLIKKGASIGTNSVILSNITIGKNSIIGAGSVVTKNIPENVIAVGNPCKIIRKIEKK
ncbi:MAG: N-acetyltransferase [bacterium (Candidatus Stahlbacteria) CG23_combo_of_CG06-09_8_20_14_all_34_7]|nr:MAG: N-acetyltransferase [bacterium (Candidatus Stahlbacteria) CG23_combo_of_CG06-09_8_20_14_all_34_7]